MSRVALVVGINTYRYDDLRDLSAPANDAEAIAQRLEKLGDFTVIRLPEAINPDTLKPYVSTTKGLTKKALEEALENLFCPDSKQYPDTALFYFSGHGLKKRRGEGFLATSDANPDQGLDGLSFDWLRKLLQDSPVKQQLIWLDCCHSGALLNVSEANPGETGQARDRCFIAASRDFEASYQALGSDYSVLTKALLEGLDSQGVGNKSLNNYDLVAFLNTSLSDELQRPIFSNFGEPITLIQKLERIRERKKEISSDVPCPYKGLAFFDDNDTDPQFFFGRSQLTNLLLGRIHQNNCLVLLGASGSGKSSVLRAGVLNQLRLGRQLSGSDRWKIQILVPSEHPIKSLAESFVDPALSNVERARQLGIAEKLLTESNAGLQNLIKAENAPCLVLVIDQFEEAFTLCQDMAERQQFFNNLIGAIAIHDQKFRLVIAMRADFFGKCVEHDYGGLAKQLEAHLVAVTPMIESELREAIVKPAQLVGCEVEPMLVEEIVRDVAGAPANLPLMQFALSELWQLKEGNRLTLQAYKQEFGGITGALEKRANAIYARFPEFEQKAVKHIFLSLTRLGEGTEDTRRRVVMANLATDTFPLEVIERVVQDLANEKLVVTDDREKGNEKSGDAIVEVAHEALIRSWSLMRSWLDENRELFRQKQKLEERAEEWRQSGKSKGFLLQSRTLQDALEFIKIQKINGNALLSTTAIDFVKASKKKRQGDQWKFTAIFLVFPLLGSLVGVHFYLLNLAQKILAADDCNQNFEIRSLIEYKFFTDKLFTGKTNLQPNIKLCNENLSAMKFNELDLTRADFRQSILDVSNFQDSLLEDSDFSSANLKDADFTNSWLKNAKFEGTYLGYANLSKSNDLNESQLLQSKLCKTKLPINLRLNPDRDCKKMN
jgi:uncharacterized protein YjbI with pentapeptide repeats